MARLWSPGARLPSFRHLLPGHCRHGLGDRPTALSDHAREHYLSDVLAACWTTPGSTGPRGSATPTGRPGLGPGAGHRERAGVVGLGAVAHRRETTAWRHRIASEVGEVGCGCWLQRMSQGESEAADPRQMANLMPISTEKFALEAHGWAGSRSRHSDFPRIQAPTPVVCGERENLDVRAELAAAATWCSGSQLPGAGPQFAGGASSSTNTGVGPW